MISELILAPNTGDGAKAGAQYVARALTDVGIKVLGQISVCKGKRDFQKTVAAALKRSNVVVTVGGLCLQSGGIAKQVVAAGLGRSLEMNEECLMAIANHCAQVDEVFHPEYAALAQLPKGSLPLHGRYDKTPGILVSSKYQHIVMLPESEADAAFILSEIVIPYITGKGKAATAAPQSAPEHPVASSPAPAAVQVAASEVSVSPEVSAQPEQTADPTPTPQQEPAPSGGSSSAYGADVIAFTAMVIGMLQLKDLGLAIAEAGAGGALTRLISEVPESSDVLRYSLFVDDNNSKHVRLGIPTELLQTYGPVSEQTAAAVANAAQRKSGAPIAISLLVGDDQEGANLFGQICIAICAHDNVCVKKLTVDNGSLEDQSQVLGTAVLTSIDMIRLFVDCYPGWLPDAISLSGAPAPTGNTVATTAPSYSDVSSPPPQQQRPSSSLRRPTEDVPVIRDDVKPPKNKLKTVIIIIAIVLLVGSLGFLGYRLWENHRDNQLYDQLNEMSLTDLHATNSDVVAFIAIPGTEIEYPVVQAADNDFYQRRNFNREYSYHGVPFVDYRVNMQAVVDNTVVYGNNMRDGRMFSNLLYYNTFDPEHGGRALDFFLDNHIVEFTTLSGEATNRYKIFSVFLTSADPAHGPVFEYFNFIVAESEADFTRFLDDLRVRSLINTGIDVQPGDRLLTLSTSTYEFDGARFVVVARRLRDSESPAIDRDQVTRNLMPLLPDIWHQLVGGAAPTPPHSEANAANPPGSAIPLSARALPAAGLAMLDLALSSPADDEIAESPAAAEENYQLLVTPGDSSPAPITTPAYTDPAPPPNPQPQPEPETESEPEPEDQPEPQQQQAAGQQTNQQLTPQQFAQQQANQQQTGWQLTPQQLAQLQGSGRQVSRQHNAQQPSGQLPNQQQTNQTQSNQQQTTQQQPPPAQNQPGGGSSSTYSGNLRVRADGREVSASALEIVSRITQIEVGPGFHPEAIKAQAVAAYSFVRYFNDQGQAASVLLAPRADPRVESLVAEVLGQTVQFNGRVAFTPYHATSAGRTNSSRDVWGGHYAYLVPVDSSVDRGVNGFERRQYFTLQQMLTRLESQLGISPSGSPDSWFQTISYTEGGYIRYMSVYGRTTNQRTGARITGRQMRENVLNLRSASFTVEFDHANERFIFTTFGHGHGVGMSQTGANVKAQQGMSYIEILAHYFPGTTVR
ncbi:MAG: SpoIID/LytB domain-containing protein [Oscillospiraceae bacterium]|nr:SpoIID/LytB domain-containing protein [Oscillospiraceae bacterium]